MLFSTDSHKDGYETFASWKKVWTSNGKSEPSLKAFMADQQLPFWVSKAAYESYKVPYDDKTARAANVRSPFGFRSSLKTSC